MKLIAHRGGRHVSGKIVRLAGAALVALSPGAAFANTGVGATHGFIQGVLHPLTGIDHLLAMVMVGLLAWQLGGRARWLLPASFMGLMMVGGALGVAGIGLPFVELGIAFSVLALGLAVALRIDVPVTAAMAAVGLFALFHGHAHGAEMPETAGGLAYGAGFVGATALLHAGGLAAGALLSRFAGSRMGGVLLRLAGGGAAAAGALMLAGVF
jgi:urease accessory protein